MGIFMINQQIEAIEDRYIQAAEELRSKQVQLVNFANELDAFIEIRDAIKAHPDFSGVLPKTFFSGGDLDPEGCEETRQSTETPRTYACRRRAARNT